MTLDAQRLGARVAAGAERVRGSLALQRVAQELAPFAVALAVFLAVFFVMETETTGDEPHYLMVAQSLAYDGDVDLSNDYADRSRTLTATGNYPLDPAPHASYYRDSGELRPVHGVGLPALLALPVALGGLTGARLAMLLIAALLADQLFRLLRDLRFRPLYRWLAWAAIVFCLPFVVATNQIYPEFPGALLALVALRVMITRPRSPAALALASAGAAAMVWLHVRYIPLSLAVVAGLAAAAATAGWRPVPGSGRLAVVRAFARRVVTTAVRRWRTVTLPVLGPYLVGVTLLALAFMRWYGTPNPTAPYRPFSETTIGSGGGAFLYKFALADMLSPVIGWIPYVPVHWLALAALGIALLRFRWPAAGVLAVAVAYELVLASAGPNVGWGLPNRYLSMVIPLAAVPLGLVIQEIRWARIVFFPLFAASLTFAAAGVRDLYGMFPIGERPRIFGLRTTSVAYPLLRPPKLSTSFTLRSGELPPRTGRLGESSVSAREDRDEPGFLYWGPYASLREGRYRATFRLAGSATRPDEVLATIEVVGTPPPKFLAQREIRARDLDQSRPKSIKLEFDLNAPYLTETRIYYHGVGSLEAWPIKVRSERVDPPRRLPDWLLAALWVAGTLGAGWFLVRSYRRRDRRHDELVGEE